MFLVALVVGSYVGVALTSIELVLAGGSFLSVAIFSFLSDQVLATRSSVKMF